MKTTIIVLLLCASIVLSAEPPECLLEFVSDYRLQMTSGGGIRDCKRLEQFTGRIYASKAEIKIDGLWYPVPRNAVMVKDWNPPTDTPK